MKMVFKLLIMSGLVATTLAINLRAATLKRIRKSPGAFRTLVDEKLSPELRHRRDGYKNRGWKASKIKHAKALVREGIHARRAAVTMKKRFALAAPAHHVGVPVAVSVPVAGPVAAQRPGDSLFAKLSGGNAVAAPAAGAGWSASAGPLDFGGADGAPRTGFNLNAEQHNLAKQDEAITDQMLEADASKIPDAAVEAEYQRLVAEVSGARGTQPVAAPAVFPSVYPSLALLGNPTLIPHMPHYTRPAATGAAQPPATPGRSSIGRTNHDDDDDDDGRPARLLPPRSGATNLADDIGDES